MELESTATSAWAALTACFEGSAPDEGELLEVAALHLALQAVPRVGTVTAFKLVRARGGICAVARADDAVGEALRSRVPAARAAVARAVDAGLGVIPFEHPDYPHSLFENVEGPPPVLFVAGSLPPVLATAATGLWSCAVVGTRRASRYSLEFATSVSRALAAHGVLVVSGLALGVDAAAHTGALEGSAATVGAAPATVAVLGGGHQRLHPAQHGALAERIVAQGGAIISEWPPTVSPAPHHFLRRNRIISGLARCVVVVEAARRSGALSTASHAVDQGRDLLVVPGRPDDPRYAGNLGLLREGAGLCLEPADALLVFGIAARSPAPEVKGARRAGEPWSSPLPELDSGHRAETVMRLLSTEAEVSLDSMVAALRATPDQDAGTPVTAVGALAAELTALLTTMELTGEVEQTSSGRYRLRRATAPAW